MEVFINRKLFKIGNSAGEKVAFDSSGKNDMAFFRLDAQTQVIVYRFLVNPLMDMQQSPAIIGISVSVVIDIKAFRDTIDPAMYESAWNCPTTTF